RTAIIHLNILQISSPAKINFFLMSEKCFVKTTELLKNVFSHKQTGSRCPENRQSVIILPFIFFDNIKNPSAAVRKTKSVDKATAGSGIFKVILSFVIQYFGLDNANFRLFVE